MHSLATVWMEGGSGLFIPSFEMLQQITLICAQQMFRVANIVHVFLVLLIRQLIYQLPDPSEHQLITGFFGDAKYALQRLFNE